MAETVTVKIVEKESDFVDFIRLSQTEVLKNKFSSFTITDDPNTRKLGFSLLQPVDSGWKGGCDTDWNDTRVEFSIPTIGILRPFASFLRNGFLRQEFAKAVKHGECLKSHGFDPCGCKKCKK